MARTTTPADPTGAVTPQETVTKPARPRKTAATKVATDDAATVKSAAPKKAAPARVPAKATGGYSEDQALLERQRQLLLEERATYVEQASALRAEAESLVEEMEPGDIQFDEESGEGGTVTVDRERDLALSAQALAAVEEIDAALQRIERGTYGVCENCGELIPAARLEALPYARLCIACKSGGLSRR
jgi:DnaK suppressor protein